MRDELVQMLSQKTGLSPEQSQEAVEFIVSQLRTKLPAPLASGLDELLAGGSADTGGSESMAEKAKAMAQGLGSVFGSKTE